MYKRVESDIIDLNLITQWHRDSNNDYFKFQMKPQISRSERPSVIVFKRCPSNRKKEVSVDQFYEYFNLVKTHGMSPLLSKAEEENTSLSRDSMCCICLDQEVSVGLPNCIHLFCRDCITQWLEQEDTCPICRQAGNSIEDVWILTQDKSREINNLLYTFFDSNEEDPQTS
eukprot:TRINITY_DN991_c0_g1_i3.p1 TRINITY_DN991_c0_g1~~TRINITY_DN991_c0_g1_i3.p1  ORF type:complete len:178 (-),score=8.83 TRINITY_DN991_c0_g1_i3:66-578(-)